ncbi:hypothetical protein MMC10_011445, partial [Thelotrema lepadinum]|nr:hypothetical protein [Thelotrema lepadinum]
MSSQMLHRNCTDTEAKTHFQNRLDKLDQSKAYITKAVAPLTRIWRIWGEDITRPGLLTGLLLEDNDTLVAPTTLATVAKIAARSPEKKNLVMRIMARYLAGKEKGARRISLKDCETIHVWIRDEIVDLSEYTNGPLTPEELRELQEKESPSSENEMDDEELEGSQTSDTIVLEAPPRNGDSNNHELEESEGREDDSTTNTALPSEDGADDEMHAESVDYEMIGGDVDETQEGDIDEMHEEVIDGVQEQDADEAMQEYDTDDDTQQEDLEIVEERRLPVSGNENSATEARVPLLIPSGRNPANPQRPTRLIGGSAETQPWFGFNTPFDQARHEAIGNRSTYHPGTPHDPYGPRGSPVPTVDAYENFS